MNQNLKELITMMIKQSEVKGVVDRQLLFAKMEEVMKIVSLHGFMNVWLAANNTPIQRIINQIYKEEVENEHITNLLRYSQYDFFAFIVRLDERNRGRILTWIMKNYNGIDYASISKNYLS